MTKRRYSRIEALRFRLQILSVSEVAGLFLVVAALVVFLAMTFSSGLNVGAHIWRSGWTCGETLKGMPVCWPAAKNATKG